MALTKFRDVLDMVDFGHTLFGLPFAYLGAFLAVKGMPTVSQLVWITLAMVGARTAALCLNRLIDLDIDRANRGLLTGCYRQANFPPKSMDISFLSLALLFFGCAA